MGVHDQDPISCVCSSSDRLLNVSVTVCVASWQLTIKSYIFQDNFKKILGILSSLKPTICAGSMVCFKPQEASVQTNAGAVASSSGDLHSDLSEGDLSDQNFPRGPSAMIKRSAL